MVTLTGTQTDFVDALKDLLELEYESVETYTAAINRLDDKSFQEKLTEFRGDHERHIKEIKEILARHNITFSPGPGGKQILAIGKVAIGSMFGDKKVLSAMDTVEDDTNKAYERMVEHPNKYQDVDNMLRIALEDERRHKAWTEKYANASA